MIPLNYNHLYYFYKIAEIGSIAEASRTIHVSAPALSMQLKELEAALGIELFIRDKKKLILTDSGSIVMEYAKDIFDLGTELKDSLAMGGAGKRVKLSIGCQDSIPKVVTDQLLKFLFKNYKCQVTVSEGSMSDLLKMQAEFELDLVLLDMQPTTHQQDIFAAKKIVQDKIIVCAAPRLVKKKIAFPKGLQDVPFIMPAYQSGRREQLESWLQGKGIKVDVIADIEDSALETQMALDGFGFIALMETVAKPLIAEKKLVKIGEINEVLEEVWLLVGKRKIVNPLALSALRSFEF